MVKEPSHGVPCPSCQHQFIVADSTRQTRRVRRYDEYPCNDCSVVGWNHFTPAQSFREKVTPKKLPMIIVREKKKHFSFD